MNLILVTSKCIYQEGDKFYFQTTARQTDHLRTILKVRINQKVKVGVINKGKGEGIIVKEENSHYVIQLVEPIHLEDSKSQFLPIDVVLCVPRPKILDKLLQQLSCVGVKRIIIVFSEYANKCYESSRVLKNEEIKQSLQLGLEQAMCTGFPEVYIHYSFNSFFMNFEKYADSETIKLCAHTDSMTASSLTPSSILNKNEGKVLFMIGCERGFSDFEIYLLKKLQFHFFHISSRILKCETALLVIIGQLLLLTENTALRPGGTKMRRNSKDRKREKMLPIRKETQHKETLIVEGQKEPNDYVPEPAETNQMDEVKTVLKNVLKNEIVFGEHLKAYLSDCIYEYETDMNNMNSLVERKKGNVINCLLKKLKDLSTKECALKENKTINSVNSINENNFHISYVSLLLKKIKYKKHLNMCYNNTDDIVDEDGVFIYKTKKYVTKKNDEQDQ